MESAGTLLNKFNQVESFLISTRRGLPFCELVLKPAVPDGFSDLYSLLVNIPIQVCLRENDLEILISDYQFSWKAPRKLLVEELNLLTSQRHPKVLVLFTEEIRGGRYLNLIPGNDGKLSPITAKLIID